MQPRDEWLGCGAGVSGPKGVTLCRSCRAEATQGSEYDRTSFPNSKGGRPRRSDLGILFGNLAALFLDPVQMRA